MAVAVVVLETSPKLAEHPLSNRTLASPARLATQEIDRDFERVFTEFLLGQKVQVPAHIRLRS
jgi:hypothetical protein